MAHSRRSRQFRLLEGVDSQFTPHTYRQSARQRGLKGEPLAEADCWVSEVFIVVTDAIIDVSELSCIADVADIKQLTRDTGFQTRRTYQKEKGRDNL